jgi:hypothetical protein
MQTFLPYPDFAKSAAALDYRRLGKQRVEALMLLRILTGRAAGKGWANHPATKMWRGHEKALADYALAMIDAWTARGYKDTCRPEILAIRRGLKGPATLPPWFGKRAFHRAHKSNLLRKDPVLYGKRFKGVPDDLPYLWPASPARKEA